MFKVNNKDTRTTPVDFRRPAVLTADFEKVVAP